MFVQCRLIKISNWLREWVAGQTTLISTQNHQHKFDISAGDGVWTGEWATTCFTSADNYRCKIHDGSPSKAINICSCARHV